MWLVCGSSSHNLLSAAHPDTTAGTVARGDIITGQGATPTWSRLAKGNQNQALLMGANEPGWATLTLAGAQFANQGTTTTVLHGNANGIPSGGR